MESARTMFAQWKNPLTVVSIVSNSCASPATAIKTPFFLLVILRMKEKPPLGVCHQAICAVDHQFNLGADSVEVHGGSQNNGVARLQELVYLTHVIFEEAVLRIGVFATRLAGPYLQVVEIGFLNFSASASGAFQDLRYQKVDVAPLVGASH